MLQRMGLLYEKHEFFIQVFQPQQRANTLVERVFVNDQGNFPLKIVPRGMPENVDEPA
jgi:hypothetical protein